MVVSELCWRGRRNIPSYMHMYCIYILYMFVQMHVHVHVEM